ncbi:biopolymer transporter ExbD [Campylobacter hyointestinalis]|uniref:Biopolymer transporter ExbD n=1 Tax=Campylobacter hyointestinalis subsp. hyointestinalis TaxID=91352 RepID=A0A855NFA3_CAMHY|nr:biopolymer transporter ExbD [Campylobacter hyointestinalis]ANE33168.1 Tol-Pal system subunit TolR [Campylobacter hyointestinalis subsp. hyointestinalis LMG 9260]KEA44764.1 biopolymer transporter ExbD [Campylobacter hyointestinalis subsp. hyointestinalis]PPB59714.1 biopolymer transporter ExbD [Campylobacter hyointestinalis subsp. hyointestinalis]PPB64645.1 biopolymer transporter ExbD [Campylobacter hyointestinalis subsp. hyointestinalis]PPB72449.1 biopolymer transporter ExbD [Campylobacter h
MINLDETPELNITPLVDIMLVLLAILMVTTPAIIYEEQITLPDGSKTKVVSQNLKSLTVRIDAQRKVYINQTTIDLNELADNLVLISQKYDKGSPVYIKADKRLIYDDVMFVLKSMKNAGFTKVALETNG